MASVNLEALGLVREQVERQLTEKRANQEWLAANRKSLRERYADQYVAVLKGKVAAADRDVDALFRTLRASFRGKDLATVVVELITPDDIIWIL